MPLPARPAIGFVGLGAMGATIADRLLAGGYSLVAYSREESLAEELVASGARWGEMPAVVASECDLVVTMLGEPAEVEEVYLGEHGLLAAAKAGAYLVDMTTSSPRLAERIAHEARSLGLHALDAPVCRADSGDATWAIVVGGDAEDLEAVMPVLRALASGVLLQGQAGAGQHAKMCDRIATASAVVGMREALVYAGRAGLDPKAAMVSMSSKATPGCSLVDLGERIVAGDFASGHAAGRFVAELRTAISAAGDLGLKLPGLVLAERLYERLVEMGYADAGMRALFELYD